MAGDFRQGAQRETCAQMYIGFENVHTSLMRLASGDVKAADIYFVWV